MTTKQDKSDTLKEALAQKKQELKALRQELDEARTELENRIDRLSTLISVSNSINSSLDLDEVLAHVTKSATRIMRAKDSCLMLLDREANELIFKIALGDKSADLEGSRIKVGQGIAGQVALTGKPLVIPDTGQDERFDGSVDMSTGFATRSIICVPIKVHEKIMGVLEVLNAENTELLSDEDLEIFCAFANSAGVAIENARAHKYALERQKMQCELNLARSVQQSLLPRYADFERYAEIAFTSQPAHTIGGDFFDFMQLDPGQYGLVIGDVAGKGVPGALLMARTISDFRLRARPGKEPRKVMEELNNDLFEGSACGMYVTAIYAVFDFGRGVLRFVNAGHPPVLLYRAKGKCLESPSEGTGIPLGIEMDFHYETMEVPLESGDLAFFYTDGIIEARNPVKEEFSLERLRTLVETTLPVPQRLTRQVMDELTSFAAGAAHHDDLTMLAVGVKHVD